MLSEVEQQQQKRQSQRNIVAAEGVDVYDVHGSKYQQSS